MLNYYLNLEKGDWGTPQIFIKKVGVVNLTIPDLFYKTASGVPLASPAR
jgi:hypothetical protein